MTQSERAANNDGDSDAYVDRTYHKSDSSSIVIARADDDDLERQRGGATIL